MNFHIFLQSNPKKQLEHEYSFTHLLYINY